MSIDLAKKHLIDLNKKVVKIVKDMGLNGQKAKVAVAIDISGSMENSFYSGEVQEATNRTLALAMNFDDNGAIDVFTFNTSGRYIGEVSEQNFYQFVDQKISRSIGGGTRYAPVMKMILDHYGIDASAPPVINKEKGLFGKMFGKKAAAEPVVEKIETLDEPIYVIFITDGENPDHEDTKKLLINSSNHGVFWKFVGIGNENFEFLKELDGLKERLIDNANFIEVNNLASIDEERLYKLLLKEFPEWLKEAKNKSLIK
ncbi:hypothetical protein D3C87_80050 [compost metagenome]